MNSDKIFEEKLKKIQSLEFEPSQIADIQKALDHTADIGKKVDNIDVEGCEFYHYGKCSCMNTEDDIKRSKQCKEISNCHYKQLQQAKADCEIAKEAARGNASCFVKFAKGTVRLAQLFDQTIPDDWENEDILHELYMAIEKTLSLLEAKDAEIEELKRELEPFGDPYFKGLDTKTIAELAKKSIRLGADNSRLERECEELKRKYEYFILLEKWAKNNCPENVEKSYKQKCFESESKLNKAIEGLEYYASGEEISETRCSCGNRYLTVPDGYPDLATQTLEEIKGKEV